MIPSSTIISDIRAAVLKRDEGFEELISKHTDKIEIAALAEFRLQVIDFLLAQLNAERCREMDFDRVTDVLYITYLNTMSAALG